jgi:hypothetical protein
LPSRGFCLESAPFICNCLPRAFSLMPKLSI